MKAGLQGPFQTDRVSHLHGSDGLSSASNLSWISKVGRRMVGSGTRELLLLALPLPQPKRKELFFSSVNQSPSEMAFSFSLWADEHFVVRLSKEVVEDSEALCGPRWRWGPLSL